MLTVMVTGMVLTEVMGGDLEDQELIGKEPPVQEREAYDSLG